MKHPSSSAFDFLPGEIRFVFSRSSGPGGQNVNKVNTRATLIFHLADSPHFTEDEKNRIRQTLANCLDKNGCIRIHCQQYRSQQANRKASLDRLQVLLQMALKPRKVRRKAKIPRSAVEKRLQMKKRRSEIKQLRSRAAKPEL